MSSIDPPQRRKFVTYGKKPSVSATATYHFEDDERHSSLGVSGSRGDSSSSRPGWKSPLKRNISDTVSAFPVEETDVFDVPWSDSESNKATLTRPPRAPKPAVARQYKPSSAISKEHAALRDVNNSLQKSIKGQSNTTAGGNAGAKRPSGKSNPLTSEHSGKAVASKKLAKPSVFDVPLSDDDRESTAYTRVKAALSQKAQPNKSKPPATKPNSKPSQARIPSGAAPNHQINLAVRAKEQSQINLEEEPSRKRRKATLTQSSSTSNVLEDLSADGVSSSRSSPEPLSRSNNGRNGKPELKHVFSSEHGAPRVAQKPEASSKHVRRKLPHFSSGQSRTLLKGQSSPAALQTAMIDLDDSPPRSNSKPVDLADHMDIDEVVDSAPKPPAPQAATSKAKAPVLTKSLSATPKQKQLWDNLLDESEAISTVKKLNFSALRIAQPASAVSPSAQAGSQQYAPRRRRLIDTLKQNSSYSSDSSMSDVDADTDVPKNPHQPTLERLPSNTAGNMNESQTSGSTAPGLRVTYAKQRSYLQDSMVDDIGNLDFLLDDAPTKPSNSRRKGQSPQAYDPFGIESDESDDGVGGFRNIHELRAAGQNKRIKAEMDTLLEDLEQADLSRSSKRTAMLDLALKLTEKEFKSHFMDMGLGSRFVSNCSKGCEDDVVLGYAFAAALAFIIKDDISHAVLNEIHQSSVISSLLPLLVHSSNIDRIAKDRMTNMSRMAISTMASLHRAVKQSSLWEDAKPEMVSPRLLAMRNLDILLRGLRQAGKDGRLLSQEVLLKVLEIGHTAVEHVQAEEEVEEVKPSDLMCLKSALTITRFASLGDVATKALAGPVLQSVLNILQSVLTSSRLTHDIETLVLHLLLALTNGDKKTLVAVSVPELVQPLTLLVQTRFNSLSGSIEAEHWDVTLNNLNLGLGTIVNLCEHSDDARLAVIYDSDEPLLGLLDIFVANCNMSSEAQSMQETQVNVARGLLAVLLGTLCQETTIRQKVRGRLPKGSLTLLIHAVEEFVSVNSRVDQMMHEHAAEIDEEEKSELWSNYKEYTAQLQAVASRLRGFEETNA